MERLARPGIRWGKQISVALSSVFLTGAGFVFSGCLNADLNWQSTSGLGGSAGQPAISFANPNNSVIAGVQLASYVIGGGCQGVGTSVELSGAVSANVPCNSGTWSTVLNLSAQADGSLSFTATLLPAPASGVAPTASIALTKDTQAPNAPVSTNTPAIPAVIFASSVQLTWSATDNGPAGLDQTAPFSVNLYSVASCSGSPSQTFSSGTPIYNLSGLADASTYSYTITARDAAGNSATSSCISTFQVNLTPFTYSLADPSSIHSGFAISQSGAVIGAWSPVGGVGLCLTETSTAPTNASANCLGGQGNLSNKWYGGGTSPNGKNFTLSAGSGSKSVYGWAADALGNVKPAAVQPTVIILDTTPPGAFSVSGITGGGDTEVDAYLVDASTGASSATINWTASSNATQYQLEIFNVGGGLLCGPQTAAGPTSGTITCALTNGTSYFASVTAVDALGYQTGSTSFPFSVQAKPTLSLNASPISGTYPGPIVFNLTISNPSSLFTVTLGSLSPNAGAYVLGSPCTSVSPGSSCIVTVTYHPTSVGSSVDPVTFTQNYDDFMTATQSATYPTTANIAAGAIAAVQPAYPLNGTHWNDYVEKSGNPLIYKQNDIACTGAETGGYQACVHAGEILAATAPTGLTSCGSLSATDSLGALNWTCGLNISGVATFYSTGLLPGKRLADLLNASSWKSNSVIVRQGAAIVLQSPSSNTWWPNSVVSKSGTIAAAALSATAYDIFTISSAAITAGLSFGAGHQSLVIFPGTGSLTYAGAGASDCNSSTGSASVSVNTDTVVCSNANQFLWIEGYINAMSAAAINSSNGVVLVGSKMSVLRNMTVTQALTNNLLINSYGTKVLNSSFTYGSGDGVNVSGSNAGMLFSKVMTTGNGGHGLELVGASGDTFREIETAGNGTNGVEIGSSSTNNFFSDVRSNNNGNFGFDLNSSSGNILSRALVSANSSSGIELMGNSSNNTLHQLTVTQNGGSGVSLSGTSSGTKVSNNLISNAVIGGNHNQGLDVDTYTSGNRFVNLGAADNFAHDIYLNASDGNSFTGYIGAGGSTPDCLVTAGVTPGLATGCTGSSASSVVANLTFVSSFIGAVSSDLTNTSNTSHLGTGPYSSTSFDWFGFDDLTRAWGRPVITYYDNASTEGQCATGSCQIWDFALQVTDPWLLNRSQLVGGSTNATWTDGAACIPMLAQSVADAQASPVSYLLYAVELPGVESNNGDGLCEAGETCVYAPNSGYYIGTGATAGHTCTVQASAVTPASMYRYPAN